MSAKNQPKALKSLKRVAGKGPDSAKNSRLEGFVRLSQVLTASSLDSELAAAYFQILRQATGTLVETLVRRFEELVEEGCDPIVAVRDEIFSDQVLSPIAKSVVLLWYTGGIQNPESTDWVVQSPEQYYAGMVWEAIGAHPPTLSNGYFGHWKYPPEM